MKVGSWTAAIHFSNRLSIRLIPETSKNTGRYEWAWLIFVFAFTHPYQAESLLKKEKKEDEA